MRLLRQTVIRLSTCHYCTKPPRNNVAKSIYISKCTDIFTNLALEDWLYQNRDFTNHHLLMLWRNEPCVVIGRHQNPWLECNFAALPSIGQGVQLARRNSGGGTVYHDMENLNLTFFTGRKEYSRRRNLELMSSALNNLFNINSEINEREDLCIDGCKISGTASKLGRTSAYHHCTLLVNANKHNLSLALKNILGPNVKTNASTSVRSKIKNLSEILPYITVDQVMQAIVVEYNKNMGVYEEFFEPLVTPFEDHLDIYGVKAIDSIDDEHFPGITKIKQTFLSNEWRFDKTPKFTIFRDISNDSAKIGCAFLVVEKGRVSDVGLKNKDIDLSVKNDNLRDLCDLFNEFVRKPFSKELLDEFEMVVAGLKHSERCRTMVDASVCYT